MTGFTSNLDLRHGGLGEWQNWTLLAPLTAELPAGTITVQAGFVTDGASIPRIIWAALSPTGRWMRAAVVHDLLCKMIAAGFPHALAPTRRAADGVFHTLSLADGTNKFTAWAMWAAVRVAGMLEHA